ncbi:MAG: hypothetical protein HZA10_08240 [Nitrospirae bacterium]|nr:hypothetical protein [Nitrospirota bacterium]
MFKLIFRIIAVFVILIVAVIALAVWKGGDGFRWIGRKTESAGRAVEKLGDMVDGIKEGKERAGKALKGIKEGMDNKEDKKQGQAQDKNEGINKRKKSE